MKIIGRFALIFSLLVLVTISCKKSKVTDPGSGGNGNGVTYIVNFANTDLSVAEVNANSSVEKPAPDPEKEGYHFENWFDGEIYTTPFNFAGKITSDTTVYAGFYADYATIEDIAEEVEAGEESKQNYHVFGEIQSISDGAAGAVTLTDGEKTINVEAVSGVNGNQPFNELDAVPEVGDTVYVYGPVLSSASGNISLGETVLENLKRTAENKVFYTVTFAGTDLEPVKIEEGQKITQPEVEKEKYIFDGWYLADDYLEEYNFSEPVTSDLTIYASFYLKLSEAINITSSLPNEGKTPEKYYLMGEVKSIGNTTYGNMTITDGSSTFDIYGLYSADGSIRYDALNPRPVVGDTVYVFGLLHRFNNTHEMSDAWLVKMKEGEIPDVTLPDYEEMTISDARSAKDGTAVIIEGIAARITYANGMSPNGFFLIDNTQAMYVFDYDIAASVDEGDRVKVAGIRTNFILDTETGIAGQLGYEGAIQLAEATLLEKESSGQHFDTSWIPETTVKEILDTDYKEENITGTIFKVNGFVKEVPGNGFTNFYVNDLDDYTGSYSYSMNNGNDFTWLRNYDDGTLKTLYLAVINGKPTNSGLLYRFVPIEILGDYNYDLSYNPEFAVKYYGVDQFEESYQSSPDKELVTEVSSAKLNIQGVELQYTSDNTASVYFVEEDGKLIFKTGDVGTADVTVTGVDGGNTYSETITIEVTSPTNIQTLTIDEAISKNDETMVTLKGIVAASLVNKSGFYLIDDTGIVAVEMVETELSKIGLGNEVIIKGNKTHYGTKTDGAGNVTAVGQLAIREAQVVANNYGNHAYSTAHFIDGKVLSDVSNLDVMEEHSAEVYNIEATIIFEETSFYTRYSIGDDNGNTMLIYSSSGGQLSFLEPVQNEKVQIELALVNWNGNGYRGSIISVTHNGTKIISNYNFR